MSGIDDKGRATDVSKRGLGRTIYTYSSIGIQLAATVVLFLLGGYKLDSHYGKSPIFTSIGAFIGMAIGFYHLIRQLKDIERTEKLEKEKNAGNDIRNKWLR
ncbi:MAG: AtpZ/AtpI family protein [Spirochaetes bacterium]|nr:AtpZ/AtpI family protein [Spirochaetota bacterium]